MRRFLILMCLLLLALPVGFNLAGCSTNKNAAYCNGVGFGQKVTSLASINLEPKITGISLAYGQTSQVGTPTGFNCKNESVSAGTYFYGSDQPLGNPVDISPSGALCGGSWNRASAGGTPDFTICSPPAQVAKGNYPGGVAHLTASADGVTSNTVTVFVHAPISSITIPTQATCVSQGHTLPLTLSSETTVKDDQGNTINPAYVGNLTYIPTDSSIVTIDPTGVATAHNPGSTAITATLSQTTSAAGYFYTCPPTHISLAFADGTTSKVVQQGAPQPLTAIVTGLDENNNPVTLTGISLQYTSTVPTQISVGATGIVSSTFPGSAAITAICQPTTCNSSPVNQIGVLGNGKPVVSNSVQVTTPGVISNYLWIASSKSQTFVSLDLNTGGIGAAVRLPYYPNSMVLNQAGSNLYFGSYRELMIVNALQNGITKEDTTVPGVVLAVSPDGSTVVINDEIRQLLYLYNTSTSSASSFGGVGTSAAFSPDGATLYVAGPKASPTSPATLYIHSNFTGWSTYTLPDETAGSACFAANNLNNLYTDPGPPTKAFNPFCAPGVAITVPSVAAFIAGTPTVAHGFCPDTPKNLYYPPVLPGTTATTDQLAATTDGAHILGAQANPLQLSDIGVTIPVGVCPANAGLTIPNTVSTYPLTGIAPTNIDQVIADPNSRIAFVTYMTASQAAGGLLPYYLTPTGPGAAGTVGYLPLTGTATAPVVGVFSPDNTLFFVGTSGDDLVHYLDVTTLTDKQQIDPKLLDGNGNRVEPEFLAVKPRPIV